VLDAGAALASADGAARDGAAGVPEPSTAADGAEADAESSTAGAVVLRYVREQVRAIVSNDPAVRLDVPDSIHKMRVATRRLRSALQTFTPVLPTTVTRPLRAELTWLAGELGAARDAEVLRHRLVAAVAAQTQGADDGPLAHTVDVETSEAYRRAHDSLLVQLDSDRYHQLVTSLDELATAPPMTRKASRPAAKVLPARAARAYATLSDLVDAAHAAPPGSEQDHELHEARKAAKKARYAGEALKDVFGEPAARFATAMEAVQEALGEHQDSVVMRERLRELAEHESSPAAAFGLGRLHALEEIRGDQALADFEVAWQQAKKKKLRRWLSAPR
jgi:CHAD domain-containing protein